MNPSLAEKEDFFKYFDAYQEFDDEGDALDSEEKTHRQKNKAFQKVDSSSSLLIPPVNNLDKLPDAVPRGPTSDTASKPDDDRVEIIAVKPLNGEPKQNNPSLGTSESSRDTTAPETTLQPDKQSTSRETRASSSRTFKLRARQSSDPPSGPTLSKKRRMAALEMKPESRQIFKGLSFYYIPSNVVNLARKMKITRAREHGANWVQNIADATHIIVDKGLTYADIKQIMDGDPNSSQKFLVNERFPTDCIHSQILFDPEQALYKVRDVAKQTEEIKDAQSTSRNPDGSLKIKELGHGASKRTSRTSRRERESSQESTKANQYSHAEEPSYLQASNTDDELSQCIREVLKSRKLYDKLGDDDDGSSSDPDSLGHEPGEKKRANFKCMKGGTGDATDNNPNAKTIKVLQAMSYEQSLVGEPWRSYAYQRAISILGCQNNEIRTAEQARALPGIGDIANKIEEIAKTGSLRQLESARNHPDRPALHLFMNVYGVGNIQARNWIARGFRTLDDIKAKAELNRNQRIGVDHFDDLNTRIPRQEIEALGVCVKKAGAVIDPEVEFVIGGSYRRGAEDSHDIDLLVTKKGTSTVRDLVPFLDRLVDTLTREGFLRAELASHRKDDGKGGSKWHGCCVLPESAHPGPREEYRPTWRRIDFLLVPETEIGAALLYFTGNDLFNRGMRLLAKKRGMKLNQRSLSGVGVEEGRDEKSIFQILGVQWREPHERWC